MTGFGRRAVSRLDNHQALLTISGIAEAGENVFFSEVRKVLKKLFLGHPRSKIVQHVIDGNSHSANARLAATLARLDRDDVLITHGVILNGEHSRSKEYRDCSKSKRLFFLS